MNLTLLLTSTGIKRLVASGSPADQQTCCQPGRFVSEQKIYVAHRQTPATYQRLFAKNFVEK